MWLTAFGWSLLIHDRGWLLADRRQIVRAEGRAPNTGFLRSWWRRS